MAVTTHMRPGGRRWAANEFDDVGSNDSAQIDCASSEVVLEELPRHDRVAIDRR